MEEIHQEDNDVMHPLISLSAVRPNSMRLSITPNPKKYDENAMVSSCGVSNKKEMGLLRFTGTSMEVPIGLQKLK